MNEKLDGDWSEVFSGGSTGNGRFQMVPPGTPGDPHVSLNDVKDVLYLYQLDGDWCEWEGAMVALLEDGRYVAASGWCDTSGWG